MRTLGLATLLLATVALAAGCGHARGSMRDRTQRDAGAWQSDNELLDALYGDEVFDATPRVFAWAPSGSLLAFLWNEPGESDGHQVWVYDAETGERRQLTTAAFLASLQAGDKRKQTVTNRLHVTEFCWRNDHELVFASRWGFYLLDVVTGQGRLIHQSDFSGRGGACSADGRWLAFQQDDPAQVHIVNIDDGALMRLSRDDQGYQVGYTHNEWFTSDTPPYVWSPVGATLLCIQYREALDKRHRVKTARFDKDFLDFDEHTRALAGDPPFTRYRLSVFDMREPDNPWLCFEQPEDINSYVYPWRPWNAQGTKLAFQVQEYETGRTRTFAADLAARRCEEIMNVDFLEQSYGQHFWAADGETLLFTSEVSGFDQLYRWSQRGGVERVSRGEYIFSQNGPLPELTHDGRFAYFSSTKDSHPNRPVHRVDLATGATKLLTPAKDDLGWVSEMQLSADDAWLCFRAGNMFDANDLYVMRPGEARPTRITDSRGPKCGAWPWVKPSLFTFPARDGKTVHGFVYRPPSANAGKPLPLLVMTYGGPGRPSVRNMRMSAYAQYFALQHGFLVAEVDVRGMWGYGREFSQCMRGRAGVPQTEDLRDAVEYLVTNEGADPGRCALFGWSFGGFQTLATLCMDPDLFQVGIAGAPVTEWTSYPYDYDILAVGEPEGQTLIPLAKNVTARVLILAGLRDSNVLAQDSFHFYRALLQAQKETQVELFLDPTGHHGLGGDVRGKQTLRKIEDYLMTHLPKR